VTATATASDLATPTPPPAAPATTPGERSGRVNGLDGLRALAALAVLFSHLGVVVRLNTASDWGIVLGRLDVGVPVFFVISGFLIYRPFVRAHLDGSPSPLVRPYLWRRVWRIYPAYWFALVGALVIVPQVVSARDLVSYVTLVHLYWPGRLPAGLQQSWSLAVEMAFYVLLPVYAWGVRRLARRRPRLTVEVVGLVGLVLVATAWRFTMLLLGRDKPFGMLSWLPNHLDLFAAGMGLALLTTSAVRLSRVGGRIVSTIERRRTLVTAGCLGTALVAFVLAATALGLPRASIVYTPTQTVLRHWTYLLVAVGVVAPVVLAGGARTHTVRFLDVRPLRWLGLVSYGIFLWHESIIELIVRQYPERILDGAFGRFYAGPVLPVVLWVLAVTVAMAVVSFVLVEVPALWLAHRRIPGWVPQPVPMALAGVVAGSFAWRVAMLLTTAPLRTDGGDPLFYHSQANILAGGRGFIEPLNWIAYGREVPTALHPPLYPLYLSVWSRLGATTYFDHKMASCVVGALVVLVTALVARRLAGDAAMIVAGVLAAFYPNLWIVDGVLYPEGLFVLLTGVGILLAYRFRSTLRLLDAAGLGVAIALAALTRGEGLFLFPLLVVPWMLLTRALPMKRRLLAIAVCGLAGVAVLAPWTIRNSIRFAEPVPLSTNGNEVHVYSNCADTYSGKFLGFWLFDCQERIRQAQGEPPGDESQRSLHWRKVGFDYARDHVSQLPKVVAARIGREWELFRPLQNAQFAAIEGRSVRVSQVGLAMYWLMVPFAAFGAYGLWRRKVPILPLGAQLVSVTITAAYAYGTTRFRAPAELVLCVLAAVGMVPLARRFVLPQLRPRGPTDEIEDPSAFVDGGRGGWHRPGAWRTWACLGIVLAVVALPLRGLYRHPGAPMEEGFMLVFPERLVKGAVPNVDFLHLYGPGSLDALALVYGVFGHWLQVERTYGLLQHLGIIFAVFALARPWGRKAATVSALTCLFLVLTPIGLAALAWNGGVALGLWSVVLGLRATAPDTRRRGWWLVGAGLLAGLTLTYRPDLVIALAVAHGFLLWRRGRPVLTRWMPGFATGLLPFVVQLATAGFGPSFQGMVLDPVVKLRPGRALPRPPSWDHLDGALQAIAERVPPWWGLPHLAAPKQLFLWFFLVPAAAFAMLGVGLVLRRRQLPRGRVLVAASLFAIGLLPQAFQRPDSAHFAWVSCVSFALVPLAVIEVVAWRRPRWRADVRVLLAGGVIVGLFLAVIPFFTFRTYLLHVRQTIGQIPPGLPLERNGRDFYLGDIPPWLASTAIIDDLDRLSKPGERLLVGPVDLRQTNYSDVDFYYLFPELTPATRFVEMDPGMANAPGSSLTADVASADWLVLTRFWSGWIEPNGSMVFGPDAPNQVVERDFCLVRSYQGDLARLYHRCPGGGAPGPYDGPYDPRFDPAAQVGVPIPPRP
jgi:peptidoglycan/LPS O-acetylase OafA/YrhL/4-amino-4-deoxy-L-arabinose transferase-like glycosyltransferase